MRHGEPSDLPKGAGSASKLCSLSAWALGSVAPALRLVLVAISQSIVVVGDLALEVADHPRPGPFDRRPAQASQLLVVGLEGRRRGLIGRLRLR